MNLKEFFKKPINIVAIEAVVLLGLVGLGYFSLNKREVHRGPTSKFDEVVYQEGVFSYMDPKNLNENIMTIKKDGSTYLLEDIIGETNISLNGDSGFKKDVLERVTKITNGKREVINDTEKIAEYSDMYNEAREEIIKKKKSQEEYRFSPRERFA